MNESDRRQYSRVRFSEPVQFSPALSTHRSGTVGLDISEGGIRMYVHDFISPGTEVGLTIQIEPENYVDCIGDIVWVQKTRYSDRYEAGIRFDENKTVVNHKELIRKHINLTKKLV